MACLQSVSCRRRGPPAATVAAAGGGSPVGVQVDRWRVAAGVAQLCAAVADRPVAAAPDQQHIFASAQNLPR